ncbi:MAG TPA: hypothetical protein VNN74_10190 [Candidatus Micrarchaeia archaeon]|nr:hypothetical protein [Candidatus Micrarchaeia archaeon]
MLRRGCLSACASCLLPIVLVVAAGGFLYHQLTTAPTYPPVAPSSAGALRRAVSLAALDAIRRREGVAQVQLGDAEVTRLLRLGSGTPGTPTDLAAHVERGQLVVTAAVLPLGQRVVVSFRYQLQPGGGPLILLHADRVGVGQIGLPGALDQLVSAGFPGQLNLDRAGGPRSLAVLCLALDPGRLVAVVRLPGRPGGGGGVSICAGPSG